MQEKELPTKKSEKPKGHDDINLPDEDVKIDKKDSFLGALGKMIKDKSSK